MDSRTCAAAKVGNGLRPTAAFLAIAGGRIEFAHGSGSLVEGGGGAVEISEQGAFTGWVPTGYSEHDNSGKVNGVRAGK